MRWNGTLSRVDFMDATMGDVPLSEPVYLSPGQEAPVGGWPWQGSLQYRYGTECGTAEYWSHVCGCSLISDT